nr:hypothetical protein [Corynebacterium ulcerans]
MNAVLIAVIVMLALAVARVHVVLALFIGALVGGLVSGIGLDSTMVAFQEGLAGGAKIALSYAMSSAELRDAGRFRHGGGQLGTSEATSRCDHEAYRRRL